jgi:hypothetical protein
MLAEAYRQVPGDHHAKLLRSIAGISGLVWPAAINRGGGQHAFSSRLSWLTRCSHFVLIGVVGLCARVDAQGPSADEERF